MNQQLNPAEVTAVWDNALRAVAEAASVTTEQLLGRSRMRYLAEARSLLVDIAFAEGFTFVEIGRRMGRSHATAIFLRRRARIQYATDPDFQILAAKCNKIYDELTQTQFS